MLSNWLKELDRLVQLVLVEFAFLDGKPCLNGISHAKDEARAFKLALFGRNFFEVLQNAA